MQRVELSVTITASGVPTLVGVHPPERTGWMIRLCFPDNYTRMAWFFDADADPAAQADAMADLWLQVGQEIRRQSCPQQPDLFSIDADTPGLSRTDHPDTSKDAALRVMPGTGTARRKVLEVIAREPATDEEIQRELTMPANTQRPRRVELVRGGWIEDSGVRRPTVGGDEAIVWAATWMGRSAAAGFAAAAHVGITP